MKITTLTITSVLWYKQVLNYRDVKIQRVYQYQPKLTSSQSIPENRYFWEQSGSSARSSVLPGFENLGRLSADWRRFGTLSRPVATHFASPKLTSARRVCFAPSEPSGHKFQSLAYQGANPCLNPNPRNPRYCNFYPAIHTLRTGHLANSCEFFIISVCVYLRFFPPFLFELSPAISIILHENSNSRMLWKISIPHDILRTSLRPVFIVDSYI